MRTITRSLYLLLTAIIAGGLMFALAPTVPAAIMQDQTLSAGIGKEGRQPHPDYPLKLVFAAHTGAYLAGIDVTIYDSAGKTVVQTSSEGPWLFVKLEPGDYKVVAKRKNGDTVTSMVSVPSSGQNQVTLMWRVPEVEKERGFRS